MKNKIEIIWLEQSAIQSVISDIISITLVGFLFWFNYNFIGGSYIVNFIVLTLIVVKVVAFMKNKKRHTIQEARKYLDELENSNVRGDN